MHIVHGILYLIMQTKFAETSNDTYHFAHRSDRGTNPPYSIDLPCLSILSLWGARVPELVDA
jgi:hypothetical protein